MRVLAEGTNCLLDDGSTAIQASGVAAGKDHKQLPPFYHRQQHLSISL